MEKNKVMCFPKIYWIFYCLSVFMSVILSFIFNEKQVIFATNNVEILQDSDQFF